ncbi:MAG TPA: helix-turn-helix domain-containing protein [Candidatus Bathyarchaeia archaeon]
MSDETVRKVLRDFGLTDKETDVYIFLAKHGVMKGGEISKQTKTHKALIYRILKSLQSKGLVESTLEFPARFTAVPFENVIDLNIRAKQEEAAQIAAQKKELLNYWQSIKKAGPEPQLEKFTVIEGNQKIYHKLSQMMRDTRNQLFTVTTVQGLVRADQFDLFDVGSVHPLKSNITFRFLAELSSQNIGTMKKLLKMITTAKFNFEGRTPELGLNLFPQMTIRDQEEAIFFITPRADASLAQQDNVCLWTNCKSLVDAFSAVFEDMWRNSTDIQKKIAEIETGKPTPKTCIIADANTAEKKYDETLQLAKEEIIMMTSSKGLIEYLKQMPLIEKWSKSGVSVRIMAPIVRENFEAAEQLSKFCAVKHAPMNYLGTTIVDGKHLFQFKTRSPDLEKLESTPHFENTFYTSNLEYVEKTKNTLNDVWKNARTPSSVTLESILGPLGPTFAPLAENFLPTRERMGGATVINVKRLGAIAEKDILNKVMNAQKIRARTPAKAIMYGTIATAVIHPPDYFNLPDMMIHVHKVEKQSTGGAADALVIFLWLETPKGYAYVPVATAGDNPSAQEGRKKLFAGTPAGQNVQLVKKDELQVRVHGNTLFAGWTMPIPLYPSPYTLPPACILIEGYGDVKTASVSVLHSSGFKSEIEKNYFDAFVTFFHPSSKYSGPGTDGFFVRDFIMTITPPQKNGKPEEQPREKNSTDTSHLSQN